MKSNFGLMPELESHVRNKGDRYLAYAQRALQELERFMAEYSLAPVAVGP